MAVLTVAWVVPVVAVNAIESRHSVDIRQLIVNDPQAYPALARHDWQDLSIGPNTAGAYGRCSVSVVSRSPSVSIYVRS